MNHTEKYGSLPSWKYFEIDQIQATNSMLYHCHTNRANLHITDLWAGNGHKGASTKKFNWFRFQDSGQEWISCSLQKVGPDVVELYHRLLDFQILVS